MARILVIEDDDAIRLSLKLALEDADHDVEDAANGEEGMTRFRTNPADLVITDIFMPKKDGHTLILDITKEFPEANIIAITGNISFDPEMELDMAQDLGATKTFQKPVKLRTLFDAIKELAV